MTQLRVRAPPASLKRILEATGNANRGSLNPLGNSSGIVGQMPKNHSGQRNSFSDPAALDFGAAMLKARTACGQLRECDLTVKEVALGIGVNVWTYRKYEAGDRTPDREVLRRLSSFYSLIGSISLELEEAYRAAFGEHRVVPLSLYTPLRDRTAGTTNCEEAILEAERALNAVYDSGDARRALELSHNVRRHLSESLESPNPARVYYEFMHARNLSQTNQPGAALDVIMATGAEIQQLGDPILRGFRAFYLVTFENQLQNLRGLQAARAYERVIGFLTTQFGPKCTGGQPRIRELWNFVQRCRMVYLTNQLLDEPALDYLTFNLDEYVLSAAVVESADYVRSNRMVSARINAHVGRHEEALDSLAQLREHPDNVADSIFNDRSRVFALCSSGQLEWALNIARLRRRTLEKLPAKQVEFSALAAEIEMLLQHQPQLSICVKRTTSSEEFQSPTIYFSNESV